MRAIVYREHSQSLDVYEYIEDMPEPTIGRDDVLVRVAYSALNRLDDWVRKGWKGLNLDWPHIPGSDFSGTIVAVGEDVTGWQEGQVVVANPLMWCGSCRYCLRGEHNRCRTWHILGEHIRGACAEYVKVPARNLMAVPEGYDLRKAAAAPLVHVTAWHNLITAGQLRLTDKVLVVGAGGGVNSVAIQIAKLVGAEVYVIAGDARKAELARQLGADWVHDRSQDPNWSKAVYLATDRNGVDMVVDNVGEATWPLSLRSLAVGGRLVTVGGTTGYNAAVPVNLIFGRHLRIIGSTMGTQDDFQTVMSLVFDGKLDPPVDSVIPLPSYRQAMERMLAGEQFGKIVIEVSPPTSS
jgi:NADPH:quinone reductase-like Zn-dependent oxidoreductase